MRTRFNRSEKMKKTLKSIVFVLVSIVAVFATSTATYFATPSILQNLSEVMSEISQVFSDSPTILLDTTTVTVVDDGAIVCDSIMQGVRNSNLADGDYIFRVITSEETKGYPVELINYKEDVRYSLEEGQTSKTISLGDNTTDYKMLVVKYHGDLTIDKGITVTATNVLNLTYKKGMYVCVMENLLNNGQISMTARGTITTPENVYLWKNVDNTYEYIPESGASGLPARIPARGTGMKGNSETDRATGSGGQCGVITNGLSGSGGSYIGASTRGTSYAGGLLIISIVVLDNQGVISSNGPNGAGAWTSLLGQYKGAVGGGSGDGSVNIFYNQMLNQSKIEATNEFAQIEFNHNMGYQQLEPIITLSSEKIIMLPVKITSQQGTVFETAIYIEKVSDNNNLEQK